MKISGKSIVGELVAADYRTASVFHAHGIDFCCRGNRPLEEACAENKVDVNQLLYKLENLTNSGQGDAVDYQSWPLDLLIDYIVKKHHRYVRSKSDEIKPFLSKIADVHGDRHPELQEVKKLFYGATDALAQHMQKEEQILFPYVESLVKAQGNSQKPSSEGFDSLETYIAETMQVEHETEGERFRTIAGLTNDYTPPADGCRTYEVTLAMLREFEQDLHHHIHLENNILFPKAVMLEKSI
jgi:regulator of cell morphogenesis and NO signaling